MKALITGAGGFVGGHLTAYLHQATDYQLYGTSLFDEPKHPYLQWTTLDLRDADAVDRMLRKIKPDLIFHLAGQAFVPLSYEEPWDTLENNIKGQVNIFEALHRRGIEARVLVVSSAHVYGKIRPEENPIDESQPFRPDSPYAVSKVAQDMLALQYYSTYAMPVIRARAFNHIGPRQNTRFALPDFAAQIAAAEDQQTQPIIKVGNLSAQRDFTDVRDVVRAYHLMLEKGTPGEAYNVCRGQAYAMQDLLERLCRLSPIEFDIQVMEARTRPVDVPLVVGDNSKLCQDTAWQPTIDIDQSLADILDYYRELRKTST